MEEDAKKIVAECHNCQIHVNEHHVPGGNQRTILEAWPFSTWGIDIVGAFPETTKKRKYLIVAVDHFTKWVEAEVVASQDTQRMIDFVHTNIITRFGIPRVIITDNGTQFNNPKFIDYCENLGIKNYFSSVNHPQSNGMTEVTNRAMVHGIKTWLGEKRTGWVDEVPNMLWAYRTSTKTATGETPFAMVYGVEAMIPVEVQSPNDRRIYYCETQNEVNLRDALDSLEEKREKAYIRLAAYRNRIAAYHDRRVKKVNLEVGDEVLKKAEKTQSVEGRGKLGVTWTGPFKIATKLGPATFKLVDSQGKELPRTWNLENLRLYRREAAE